MSLSNLAHYRGPAPRTNPPPNNASLKDRVPAPAAPAPAALIPAEVQQRIAIETLTPDDVRDLSIESINLLIPHNPKLVGQLIINAGKMRRGELPLGMFRLGATARAVLLCGEMRRGCELNEEEADFMATFLESIGAAGA
jgi:hypothetical protein